MLLENLSGRLFPCFSAVLLSAVLLTGCPPSETCLECGVFEQTGDLLDLDVPVTECSGLVSSQTNPGVLWLHNDSGHGAQLYAVKEEVLEDETRVVTLLGVYTLQGAGSVDWEDMAWGPCSEMGWADCLYVGDIGDNGAARSQIQVYRVEEPVVPLEGGPVYETLTGVERFDCQYPDGAHNAETLLVDPVAGIPYIVTKEAAGSTGVYRFPGPPDPIETATLEKLTVLEGLASLTGGDVSPDSSRVVLRDYLLAYEYPLPGGGDFSDMFLATPCVITLTLEPQGEALAVGSSGVEIYTASEKSMVGEERAPVHKTVCSLP